MKQMQQAQLSTKVRSDMTRRGAARSSFRIIVYNIMHNELAISLQIEIADKSEDAIEQIASLSYLSLSGRRRNKRHGCFFGSVLFLSRPRSEGWPHHGRTFSIYPCPLSF